MIRAGLVLFFGAFQVNAQLSCTKLASIYDSACPDVVRSSDPGLTQGRPGKMGPAGEKGGRGERGLQGPRGPATEVNYSHVEDMIARSLEKGLRLQSEKFLVISSKLEQVNAEISKLKNESGFCPISYDGKCFWVQIRSPYVTCQKAQAICAEQGGSLANVYSGSHYYMLKVYWEMFAALNVPSEIHAIIGLKYDYRSGTVSLSDGRPAPYLKWYPGYPKRNGACMAITTRMSRSSIYHHMHNFSAGGAQRGIICEK